MWYNLLHSKNLLITQEGKQHRFLFFWFKKGENTMHKKQKIKKFLTACIATIYSLTSLISITPVQAKSYSGYFEKTGFDVYHNFPPLKIVFLIYYSTRIDRTCGNFSIDGSKAYCVEPGVQFSWNPLYAQEKIPGRSIFYKLGYSDSDIDRMGYIASLGYGFNGDTSKAMIAATQLMIWQVKKLNGFSQIPSAVQAKVNIINDRLNTIYKNVSFANNTVEIEGITEKNMQSHLMILQVLSKTTLIIRFHQAFISNVVEIH